MLNFPVSILKNRLIQNVLWARFYVHRFGNNAGSLNLSVGEIKKNENNCFTKHHVKVK